MRTLTVLTVLWAAASWADPAAAPGSDAVCRGRCGSKGSSCEGTRGCCKGFTCSMGICEADDKTDALLNDEAARKKAHAERRDEPSR